MNIAPLKREIEQLAKDKGIDRDTIIGALEEAMRQAARKKFGQEKEIEARFNAENSEIELFEFREVVEQITDPANQILLARAREFDPDAEVGDEIGVKLDTADFGRILAQAAKQVIIQRVRDAERDIVFDEYKDRKGEIVNGIVRRFEKGAPRPCSRSRSRCRARTTVRATASAPTWPTSTTMPRARRSCSRARRSTS